MNYWVCVICIGKTLNGLDFTSSPPRSRIVLQNVELQNAELQNYENTKRQITKRRLQNIESYKMVELQNVESYKR